MSIGELWSRYEDWQIRRCGPRSTAADLLGGALLLPIAAWVLGRAVGAAGECGAGSGGIVVGALLLAIGWSCLGRAFWGRIVRRLSRAADGERR